mmetsp:Transcript_11998/g.16281  ORF Transcript_11998/g.16281 Transcript_11998/m.16281 type:complete len:336 (-) Transcript_11998:259-1266(-)|eukprot:CAMPEP_0196593330 /NCGR_PEP_ID=MMETSP1081-20130531/75344_1 /TAXON_ID=36882 /ORGANISM="Pyramimonas amylifera, Strain CCMP720" /LENGTH=335 /DNA_ID=CAMNT_0041917283 /DNA_START=427 /DNA_END=1434 /DNA_ORIENTATION=-
MGQCSAIAENLEPSSENAETSSEKEQCKKVSTYAKLDNVDLVERGTNNDPFCEATASGGGQESSPRKKMRSCGSCMPDIIDWRELPGGPMLRMFELMWNKESGYTEVHKASRVCRSWRACALEILMRDTAASKPRRATAPTSNRTQLGTLPGQPSHHNCSDFSNLAAITVEGGTGDCEAISRHLSVNGQPAFPVNSESCQSEGPGARAGPSGYHGREKRGGRGGKMGACSSYRTPSFRTTTMQCRNVGSQTPSTTVDQMQGLNRDKSDVRQGRVFEDAVQDTSMIDSEHGVIEGPLAVGPTTSAQSEPSNSVPQVLRHGASTFVELSSDEATSGQ